jgi:hypothetical protein
MTILCWQLFAISPLVVPSLLRVTFLCRISKMAWKCEKMCTYLIIFDCQILIFLLYKLP